VAGLSPALVQEAMTRIGDMIDAAVDRARLTATPIPVVVVGGGRILVQRPIAGAGQIIVPPHYEAANAVGAAIAQISGELERVFSLEGRQRSEVMAEAEGEAAARAVAAGAVPASVTIVEREDVPLAYLPGNATRVRVKAVGDLAL
jgi:N-methylhydantoinase A/oxoprolinase/acetone carboxylase beta subunit